MGFSGIPNNDGISVGFNLPGSGTTGSTTLVGVLRITGDWNESASDADLLYTFAGCPSVQAAVNDGCRIYGGDQGTSKPAVFETQVLSHDLTVDPTAPGARKVFVYNKGPQSVSGVLQVTFTTGGPAPSGGITCSPVAPPGPPPDPTATPTPGTTPTPLPTPTPTPRPTASPTPPNPSGYPACTGVPSNASCGKPTGRCNNGQYTCAQNRQGTCSPNGGLQCVVCPGPLCY